MACLQQRWPPEGPGKGKHPLLSILPACLPEAAADRVCLQATAVAATSDKVQPAAALPRELQQLVTTFSSVGAVYGCLALSNALEADLEVHGEVPMLEFGGFQSRILTIFMLLLRGQFLQEMLLQPASISRGDNPRLLVRCISA